MLRTSSHSVPDPLVDCIEGRLLQDSLCIVGIDGCGGAGKSYLANNLSARFSAQVVHMDDFYHVERQRPRAVCGSYGEEFDWQRLREEILEPLHGRQIATYRIYDWDSDRIGPEPRTISPRGVVIIEGVYSTRMELLDFYDVTVWVECPHDIRLARGLARDGDAALDRWVKGWMPQEERYLRMEQPNQRADFRISGYPAEE